MNPQKEQTQMARGRKEYLDLHRGAIS